MATVDPGARNVPPVPADDLDDLFDYDVSVVFKDVDTNMDIPARRKSVERADIKENRAGLGIDEEIKVTKKRAPVPKLDENRLLSQAGIPKLRLITKERLKFKGKGYEYSDIARLLNVYQLWLDDLYPRAKFADGLAIIEKLGHSKRMQALRKEWINEGKPRENLDDLASIGRKSDNQQTNSIPGDNRPRTAESNERPRTLHAVHLFGADDDELYAATPRQLRDTSNTERKGNSKESLFVSDDEEVADQPPYDDLDALLAEDEMSIATRVAERVQFRNNPTFDDEMEAMADMDDMW